MVTGKKPRVSQKTENTKLENLIAKEFFGVYSLMAGFSALIIMALSEPTRVLTIMIVTFFIIIEWIFLFLYKKIFN